MPTLKSLLCLNFFFKEKFKFKFYQQDPFDMMGHITMEPYNFINKACVTIDNTDWINTLERLSTVYDQKSAI